jgi:AraC-like DNA-binding protein
VGRRAHVADVNRAHFFAPDQPYRVSHPVPGGDRCSVFELRGELVEQLGGGPGPLPSEPVPTTPEVHLRHRRLVSALAHGEHGLGAEELAQDVVVAVLTEGGCRTQPRLAETPIARRRRTELVESVRTELARNLDTKLDLRSLAFAVGASPFHLTRVFREHTGETLRRYHLRLRLRAALERLSEGEEDLTSLALDLGFSHHSHFSNAFRREFGCTPSSLRSRPGRPPDRC